MSINPCFKSLLIKLKLFVYLLFASSILGYAAAQTPGPVSLHKGTNAWPWLYRAQSVDNSYQVYPTQDTFPYAPLYTPERLAALKSAGFDFVRIQLETTPFLTTAPEQRGKLIEQVIAAVRRLKAAGLKAIICPFPRDIVARYSAESILASEENRRSLGLIELQLAAALAKEDPEMTVFEILNEPPGGYHAEDRNRWFDLQRDYVKAIRRVAPNLTLLITGDRGGGAEGLLRTDPRTIDDPRILYSFHYYDPMVFTHQGVTGTSKKYRPYLSGFAYPPAKQDEQASLTRVHEAIFKAVPNPGEAGQIWRDAETQIREYYETPQGKAKVEADFAKVSSWAKRNHIAPSRIVLGEFGPVRHGMSTDSIVNWVRDVRTSAEQAGFAWCVFNYQPDAKPPAMSIEQMAGSDPNALDPGIIRDGLGLSATAPKQP
jgi:hypothetical protein